MRLRTPATSMASPLTTFGLYLNLSAALIAARSKMPGGFASTTTGLVTAPGTGHDKLEDDVSFDTSGLSATWINRGNLNDR